MNLDALSDETFLKIFSYLKVQDLCRCSQVNTLWKRLASDNSLWKKMCHPTLLPQGMSIKRHIASLAVVSSKGVMRHMKKIAETAETRQDIQFTCHFPLNPEHSFTARLQYCYPTSTSERISECIFLKQLPQKENKLPITRVSPHWEHGYSIQTVTTLDEMLGFIPIMNSHLHKKENRFYIAATVILIILIIANSTFNTVNNR